MKPWWVIRKVEVPALGDLVLLITEYQLMETLRHVKDCGAKAAEMRRRIRFLTISSACIGHAYLRKMAVKKKGTTDNSLLSSLFQQCPKPRDRHKYSAISETLLAESGGSESLTSKTCTLALFRAVCRQLRVPDEWVSSFVCRDTECHHREDF